jgi:NAD+ diphosphatase
MTGVVMKNAEVVTFGGSGLDRAAYLREDPAQIAVLWTSGRVLAMWRGKPLIGADGQPAWLPSGHPVFGDAEDRLFLGLDDGNPAFACDIEDWATDADTSVQPGFLDQSVQWHPRIGDGAGFHELRAVMVGLSPRSAELVVTAKAMLQWHKTHGFCACCGAASQMAKAGWQRNCPVCKAVHFPRTDPVVIMLVLHGNRVLLGRSPGWPGGMYSLLAGFVEPGETVEAAVRREVQEESGVVVGVVNYLASQPWPFPASLMIGCRAEATTDVIRLDPAELEDAFWLTREELLNVMAGQHSSIRPPRFGSIAQFLMSSWLADRLD